MSVSQKPARISHEGRVVLLAFLAGLPGSATALWMLWAGNGPARLQWTLTVLIVDACLDGPPVTTLQTAFPGGAGRWGVRRTRIREHGLPLELVVISDLTQALSEQELHAWQRLVRVLGHELNNSLAPVKSISGSLEAIVSRDELPDDWRDDMRRGLRVIVARSQSLGR